MLAMHDDTTSLGEEGRSGELRNNGSTVESLYANREIMMNASHWQTLFFSPLRSLKKNDISFC